MKGFINQILVFNKKQNIVFEEKVAGSLAFQTYVIIM